MEQKYYVYMAKCGDGTWYTGWTNDLVRRERMHNEGKGARYTRGRRPVKIEYAEEFNDKGAALKREYEIKQMTRKEKEGLVE